MGTLIRLRSPRGKVRVVDPTLPNAEGKKVNVNKLLAKGWTRAGSVMIAAHERSMPKRQEKVFTPAESQAAGITPETEFREEPLLVSQLGNIGGMVGDPLGRMVGGAAGLAAGAAASAPTAGAAAPGTVPAGVVVGQEIGGPVGAGLLAGAGEGVRQLIDLGIGIEGPEDPMGEILRAAGVNAGASVVGGVGAHALKGVGKAAMGVATRATPEGIQAAIREGITVTKGGVNKLKVRLGEYGGQMRQLMANATNQGVRHDPVDIVKRALSTDFRGQPSLAKTIMGNQTGDQPKIMENAVEEMEKFLNRHGVPSHGGALKATPANSLALLRLRQEADKIARPIYAALENSQTAASVSLESRTKAHVYRAIRDAVDELLEQTTPPLTLNGREVTYRNLNAAESGLIQLKEAIAPDIKTKLGFAEEAARRAIPSGTGMAVGAGLGAMAEQRMSGGEHRGRAATTGAALGAALMNNPAALSRLALLLNSGVMNEATRVVPRLGVAAFTERRSDKGKKK